MKIPLDTHILLWWTADDRRLPRPARLVQLPSKAEAQALADALRGKMGVAEPKLTM